MFFLIFFFISFIGLIIATITDLKNRIVSNKLTYPLIVIGIALHLIQVFFAENTLISINSLIAFAVPAITFVCGYGLWKLGVWAGGDVKMFTALAALNPLNPNLLGPHFGYWFFESISLPLFPLTLFLFSILAMLPSGAFLTSK